jgi:hypothetical protein
MGDGKMKIVVLTLAFVIASTTANAQTASTSAQRWQNVESSLVASCVRRQGF